MCASISARVSCSVPASPPDSSSCPAGSSDTEALPLRQADRVAAGRGSAPSRPPPPCLPARARMPPGSYGGGGEVGVAEAEFLVLGADGEPRRAACSRRRGSRPAGAIDVIGVASASPGLDIVVPFQLARRRAILGLSRRRAPAAAPARRSQPSRRAGCADRAPAGTTKACRRRRSSSAAVNPPSGPTSSAGRPPAIRAHRRRVLPLQRRHQRAARPASPPAAPAAPPGRRCAARSAARTARPPRWRSPPAGRGSPAPRRCARSAPAAARRRRVRSPSRTTRSVASRFSGAKASHRSGSGACGRSRRLDRQLAAVAAQRGDARRPFAVARR